MLHHPDLPACLGNKVSAVTFWHHRIDLVLADHSYDTLTMKSAQVDMGNSHFLSLLDDHDQHDQHSLF